jgi:hypothetical protein
MFFDDVDASFIRAENSSSMVGVCELNKNCTTWDLLEDINKEYENVELQWLPSRTFSSLCPTYMLMSSGPLTL